MTSMPYRYKKKIVLFLLVSVILVSSLTFLKVLMSYYSTDKASQLTLAKQYIAIAEDIASGLDIALYEKVLSDRKYDGNSDSIKQYLEQYRSRINVLYIYTLTLDESDVAKTMIAAFPPGMNDRIMGVPCTVPPNQVGLAKQGKAYYTDVIEDDALGLYFSVGVPIYNEAGTLLGTVGIDIDANQLESIGHEVVNGSRMIFSLDVLFVLVLLIVIYTLHKWYRTRLNRDLHETERMYISEMGKVMSSIKASRHDLMNHFQVLNGLLTIKAYDRANDYIKQLAVESRALDLSLRVSNPVLMVLLQSKWELANSKNIELRIESEPHEFGRVASMDLVKMLTNLLDNAIEAVEAYEGSQPRLIRVVCRAIGSKYLFSVENPSLLTPKQQKSLFDLGFTTKENENQLRGTGLVIIQQTVNLYNGDIRFRYEDEIVTIQITL